MKAAIDHPGRIDYIRGLIENKKPLRQYYLEIYQRYLNCLAHCPQEGKVLELGSGGGFLKKVIPDAVTSDVLPYAGVDEVIDASRLTFPDQSLKAIFMSNVLHHITDVDRFFREASRCLVPGGRIFMVDQYSGVFGSLIYRYLHHEPFDPNVTTWNFVSSGPLSGANGALACIVFKRDIEIFHGRYPLKMVRFEPHSPLRYWWMGGLKKWSLLPSSLDSFASRLDEVLIKCSNEMASFVDIELVR